MIIDIFISRTLTENSILRQFFLANNFVFEDTSMIQFTPVPFNIPKSIDWLFFNSRKGVDFFTTYLREHEQLHRIDDLRIACIGPSTGLALQKNKISADFIPTIKKNADLGALEVGRQFANILLPHEIIGVVRATHSNHSIAKSIQNKCRDIVVYDNTLPLKVSIPSHKIAILTSSKNAHFYASSQPIAEKIIAIGAQTAKTIKKLGLPLTVISEIPSEKGLLTCLKKVWD